VSVPVHTYVLDTAIWPALDNLATCLCEELIRSGLPPLCFCGVVAGEPAYDVTDEDRGTAWVRAVTIAPTSAFPAPDTSRLNCGSYIMAQLEIGVMRCFPAAREGIAPTEMEQWEQTRLQMADMAAMRRAVLCCQRNGTEFALGQYTSVGPMGGWVGGTWLVYMLGV
jgi:hypothetical protein